MKRNGRGNGDGLDITNALLYTRVSGAEHQREGLSLEAQRTSTRVYAAKQPSWLIAGEYEDIMSGKRADRPQYQAMLEHARRLRREGKRAAIVVVKLDRLGRNKSEYFRAAEELARQGADVHSIKDGGRLDETHSSILAVFAAKEAKDIGERVSDTRASLVTNGHHYGRVPFGYRNRVATDAEVASGLARKPATTGVKPVVFEPDPVTRAVATEVFELVAAGTSINAAAKWLAGLPDAMRGGRQWPARCVASMLRSATYVARPAEGVDDVLARPAARWEPLVSDATWQAVQTFMAGHEARPHQTRYLLTSFLRCAVCGERMVGMRRERESGRAQFQYRCKGWTRGANARVAGCRQTVPMGTIERAVLDEVGGVLEAVASEPQVQASLRRAWQARQQHSDAGHADTVRTLEATVERARRRLTRATELLVDGTIARDAYDLLAEQARDDMQTAERELATSGLTVVKSSALPPLEHVFGVVKDWIAVLHGADIGAQRDTLGPFVERVVPVRVKRGSYRVIVTWTDLGEAVRASVAPEGYRSL